LSNRRFPTRTRLPSPPPRHYSSNDKFLRKNILALPRPQRNNVRLNWTVGKTNFHRPESLERQIRDAGQDPRFPAGHAPDGFILLCCLNFSAVYCRGRGGAGKRGRNVVGDDSAPAQYTYGTSSSILNATSTNVYHRPSPCILFLSLSNWAPISHGSYFSWTLLLMGTILYELLSPISHEFYLSWAFSVVHRSLLHQISVLAKNCLGRILTC
jgi:hypothetical protein